MSRVRNGVAAPPCMRWLAVGILLLAYSSSFVDRQIMSLLVMPIRYDLHISDTQFSLLNGLAFASFYALLGLPIAWLADREDRPVILALGTAVWSAFTIACGCTNSFGALFVARVGVGSGEGTLVPCTYSLLADYFPPKSRGVAMGVFGAGVYAGIGLALIVGGVTVSGLQHVGEISLPIVGRVAPWQMAFMVVGAPGAVIAAMLLCLPEPRRSRALEPQAVASIGTSGRWPRGEVLRAIGYHHLATGGLAMALYGVVSWAPEYLRRAFHLSAADSGLMTGSIVLVFGTFGVVSGGYAADYLLNRDVKSARLLVLAVAGLVAAPCLAACFLAPTLPLVLAGLALSIASLSMLTACGPLGVQELYPPDFRGRGAAIFQLVVTLLGLGVGPSLIALISDTLFFSHGGLGAALAASTPVMTVIAGLCALAGLRSYVTAADRVGACPLHG